MKVFYNDVANSYDNELAEELRKSGDLVVDDVRRRALGTDPGYLRKWTGGVVPFTFNDESTFTNMQKKFIVSELAEFTARAPVITFRMKMPSDDNYVSFNNNGLGCWSYLGMVGGGQTINLGKNCVTRRTIQHEVLHALGFWHEQSRPDRDSHVKVLKENVMPGMLSQFKTRKSIDSLDSPYDTKSVMHYGMKTFSKNGKNTMEPGPLGSAAMTMIDVKQLSTLYGAPPPPSVPPTCKRYKRNKCRKDRKCRWRRKKKKCVKKN